MAQGKKKIDDYKNRFDSPMSISNLVLPKPKAVKKSNGTNKKKK